ncbi:hypothetical protein R7V41_00090 [Mesomycoplasma ovipneumoniae]|uniref:Uncharacterized protein n=1 Tax=Mesomycoplasma ovipneumoniae TaxID=29562 RepID=A0AAJ2UED4_9BACT|nr:hypothetical protein [Mesomycoplasma ovipneumoniae]MDW2906111.1 hypothetical protein [Mesomycoplasma ovipneumoniae]MDW2913928.1 hypothetical protein [Mesomycoplasma ovipneumoniae]
MNNKISPCIWTLISNTHLRKAESLEILIKALYLNKEEINQNFKSKWLKIYKNKNWKPVGDLSEHIRLASQLGIAKTNILANGQQKLNILAKLINNGTIKVREYISIVLFNLVTFINEEYRHLFKMTLELLKEKKNHPVSVDEIFDNFNFGESSCSEFDEKFQRYNLTQKDHIFYILTSGIFFEVLSFREKTQQYSTKFFKIKLFDYWYLRIDELISKCNNQLESYNFEKASLIRQDPEKWSNYLTSNSQANYDYIISVLKNKTQEMPPVLAPNETPTETTTETSIEEKDTQDDLASQNQVLDQTQEPETLTELNNPEIKNAEEIIKPAEKKSDLDEFLQHYTPIFDSQACCENNPENLSTNQNYPMNLGVILDSQITYWPESTEKNLENPTEEYLNKTKKSLPRIFHSYEILSCSCENSQTVNSKSLNSNLTKIEDIETAKEETQQLEKNSVESEKICYLPTESQTQINNVKLPASTFLKSREHYFNYFINNVYKLVDFSIKNLLNQPKFKQNFFNLLDRRKINDEITISQKQTKIISGKNIFLISPSQNQIYYEIKNNIFKDFLDKNDYEIATFSDSYTIQDFVGYSDFSVDEKNQTNFIPGPFSRILRTAFWNPDKKYFLILENMDKKVTIDLVSQLKPLFYRDEKANSFFSISLPEVSSYVFSNEDQKIYIPANLTIIATAVVDVENQEFDFPIDLLENWDFKHLPNKKQPNILSKKQICDTGLNWDDFLRILENQRANKNQDYLLQLPFEIDQNILENPDLFVNKVLFFLWSFTFKNKRELIFNYDSYLTLANKFVNSEGPQRLKIFKANFFES